MQDVQVSSAPSALKVSIRTAVWMAVRVVISIRRTLGPRRATYSCEGSQRFLHPSTVARLGIWPLSSSVQAFHALRARSPAGRMPRVIKPTVSAQSKLSYIKSMKISSNSRVTYTLQYDLRLGSRLQPCTSLLVHPFCRLFFKCLVVSEVQEYVGWNERSLKASKKLPTAPRNCRHPCL